MGAFSNSIQAQVLLGKMLSSASAIHTFRYHLLTLQIAVQIISSPLKARLAFPSFLQNGLNESRMGWVPREEERGSIEKEGAAAIGQPNREINPRLSPAAAA